jgi:hypothetical protein
MLDAGNRMAETNRFLPDISAEMRKPKTVKGQASIEFTMMAFFALAFLLASSFIYYQESTEALELKEESDMRSICASLSAKVSGLEIAGPGASVKLDYPAAGRGGNYSLWVNPGEGIIQVVRQDAPNGTKAIGLAYEENIIDPEKLQALKLMDYNRSKELMGLSTDYYMRVRRVDGVIMMEKGARQNESAVSMKRIAVYNGSYSWVELDVYR